MSKNGVDRIKSIGKKKNDDPYINGTIPVDEGSESYIGTIVDSLTESLDLDAYGISSDDVHTAVTEALMFAKELSFIESMI